MPSDGVRLFLFSAEGELTTFNVDARSYSGVDADGVLVIGQAKDNRGHITAYDPTTFQQLWRYTPGNNQPHGYPYLYRPIIENGIVYAGTAYGQTGTTFGVFALDAASGAPIWEREGIQNYAMALEGDYLYVYDAGGVAKIDKRNGQVLWHTNFGNSGGLTSIAVGYGHVYAPHSGAMRILDAETGAIVDIVSPPDGSYYWLVTVGRGRVFAQSTRHLYAFAPWGRTEALE